MLFKYGDSVSVATGFYDGQTGTVVKVVLSFEGEVTFYNYVLRLDAPFNDLTDLVPESLLSAA